MSMTDSNTARNAEIEAFEIEKMSLRASVRMMMSDAHRMLQLIREAAPGVVTWIAIAALIESISTTSLPYATKRLIDSIPLAHLTGIVMPPLIWVGVEALLMLIKLVAISLLRHGIRTLEVCAGPFLVERVLEKSCRVAYSCFETPAFLDRLSRARQDAPQYGVSFSIHMITVAHMALIFFCCMGLLLWMTPIWTLPIIVLAAVPPFIFDLMRARRSFELDAKNMHRNRQSYYVDWLLSTAEPIKEIRALGIGRWLVTLHERVIAPFRDGQVALSRKYFWLRSSTVLTTGIALYGPFVYFVFATIRGETTIGQLIFFILIFNQCSNALTQLLSALANAFEHHLYVHNLLQVLDHPEEEVQAQPKAEHVFTEAPEFIIKDLCFSYPGSERPVLRRLNLHVRAGETLAIVGRNGIGKTTFVKILLGLYPITQGQIIIGGIDVATQSIGWRRDNIAVVLQDFVRFQFGAGQSVGVGWCPDADNEQLVARALEMAEAEKIIEELPQGFKTPLGPAFGGRDLSGGQWQRFALARLFMRKSRLWIMDEPTSAMDPETEERTFRCFRQWSQDRTAIIITHRFSTARIADRIAVIDDGCVSELGTHEELLAARGHYARMFTLQAQAYATSPSP